MPRLRVVVRPVSMQRCDVFRASLFILLSSGTGSPFDAFNLPNESIPQAGRNSGSACSEKSLPVHRSLLGGSERRSLEADCTPQKNFGWPSPLGVRLYGSLPKLPRLFLSAGLENVLRMSPTRSLLHLLGRGAGPVIRRVWTLTCDRETRRPRPRRDGAKPTGAGAPRHWRSGILWLAAAERNCVAVALGSGTLCKTGFPARGSSVRVALLGVLAPLCSPCTQLRRRTS